MKTRYLLLTVALLGLAVALVGCQGPHLVTSTPAAKVTDVVVTGPPSTLPPTTPDTVTSTATLTVSPTVIPTPTVTLTATEVPTPAITPTSPASTVNLRQVLSDTLSQVSYRMAIQAIDSQNTTKIDATFVRDPSAAHLRWYDEGAVALHCVTVGDREWIGLGTVPMWLTAPSSVLTETQAFADSLPAIVAGTREFVFPDQVAEFSGLSKTEEGVACLRYIWEGEGAVGDVCLDPHTGLPLFGNERLLEGGEQTHSFELRFSHYNDPANVIPPPISGQPETLHIDDARMALNGLSSFRWTASVSLVPGQSSSSLQAFDWAMEGTYVLENSAFRSSVWLTATVDMPPTFRCWAIGHSHWIALPSSDQVFRDGFGADTPCRPGAPYYNWETPPALGEARRVEAGRTTINGELCDKYQFTLQVKNPQGNLTGHELMLFVTSDTRVPMRLEDVIRVQADGTTVTQIWEISHINDPANVVEPPQATP